MNAQEPNGKRAKGWKHAKQSGHINELRLCEWLQTPDHARGVAERILDRPLMGSPSAGGASAKRVPSVLGGTTSSKVDLTVRWEGGEASRISVKKSKSGQVFLISTKRFISGYQAQFGQVPESAVRAIELFMGSAKDSKRVLASLDPVTEAVRDYEIRKGSRLCWESLQSYDANLAESMLEWIRSELRNITSFCFSKGLATRHEDWANLLWYRNLVDREAADLDKIFRLQTLIDSVVDRGAEVVPGTRNGGSTIQLPFGFLQWHQGKIQIHHKLDLVEKLSQPQ